jgi:hypothetical protein
MAGKCDKIWEKRQKMRPNSTRPQKIPGLDKIAPPR